MIGRLIGNYRVVSKLGEGGMGTVYLAEHPELGRTLAVKVLHPHLIRDPQSQARFLNEARAASALRHPNVVDIIDVGTLSPEGTPYLVMEHLVGEDLAARLRTRRRFGIAEAVALASQIAAALGAAHARGIVHRDLKPANLFVVADDTLPGREKIKVVDFGVAKLQGPLAGGSLRTETGQLLGTPLYMSPEQCRGAAEIDHRSDLYSLGLILYEMLCGAPPFVSSAIGEMVVMHTTQAPDPPRRRNADIPEHLDHVILRALAKDPDQRFATAAELQAALAFVQSASQLGPSPGAVPAHAVAPTYVTAASVAVPATAGHPLVSGGMAALGGNVQPSGPRPAMGGYAQPSGPVPAMGGHAQPSGPVPVMQASGPLPMIGGHVQPSGPVPVMQASGPLPMIGGPAQAGGPLPMIGGRVQVSGPVQAGGPLPMIGGRVQVSGSAPAMAYAQASGPVQAGGPLPMIGGRVQVSGPAPAMAYAQASGPVPAMAYAQVSGASAPIGAAPAQAGGPRATRFAHDSIIMSRPEARPAEPRSRAGLWALAGGACLAIVAAVLFVLGRQPAAAVEHKPDPAAGATGSSAPDAGTQALAEAAPPPGRPGRPPPRPEVKHVTEVHKPQAQLPVDPRLKSGTAAPPQIASGQTAPQSPPPLHQPQPPPHQPLPQPQPAQPPQQQQLAHQPQPPQQPPRPVPPSPIEQPGIVEACARSCRRLAACGLRPSATCEQSCTSSPRVSACAVNAEDSCNGAASCALTNRCSGVGPSGAATCNATFECTLRCGTAPACSCHCAQMMAPGHAMAWLMEQQCAGGCRGDQACVRTRCSRYILACQAD